MLKERNSRIPKFLKFRKDWSRLSQLNQQIMASPHPSTSRLIPPSTSLPTISHDFTKELSIYLETIFVPAVKPTSAEYAAKEGVRQFLESLTQRIGIAKLLPFGLVTPSD